MIGERSENIDWFLQGLVALVEDGTMTFGLTLTIPGAVITGQLISFKEYLNEFNQRIAAAKFEGDKQVVEATKESMSRMFKYPEGPSEAIESVTPLNEEEKNPGPEFIHLKSALVFTSNVPFHSQPILWRGKLSDVSGFSWGAFSVLPS